MKDYRYTIEKGPFGRDVTERAKCPFCGLAIERPRELDTHRPGEMPVGVCSCGAVFAYDASGHNLGSAFSEALVFACNMDWDLAWDLLPGEDYLESLVEKYDIETNRIVPSGHLDGRKIRGALYFIRLHEDIREATREGVRDKINRARPAVNERAKPPVQSAGATLARDKVEQLVREYRMEPLLEYAATSNRIIRDLQRLIYSGDELLRMRAAEAMGRSTAVIARRDPGAVAKLLYRLFTALGDTASSSWGAVDAAGEIIASSPGKFSGYIPELYRFLADDLMRPGVLRALWRIAETRPDLLPKRPAYFTHFLKDSQPQARGYAALLLGALGAREVSKDLEQLLGDQEKASIYAEGRVITKTVGELASDALEKIRRK